MKKILIIICLLLCSCARYPLKSSNLTFEVVSVELSGVPQYRYDVILKSYYFVNHKVYFEFTKLQTNQQLEQGQWLIMR